MWRSVQLDGEIVKLFWNKKIEGETKMGRRLVAKNRIDASFEKGGLKMDFTIEIANRFVLNGLQSLGYRGEPGRRKKAFYLLFRIARAE